MCTEKVIYGGDVVEAVSLGNKMNKFDSLAEEKIENSMIDPLTARSSLTILIMFGFYQTTI